MQAQIGEDHEADGEDAEGDLGQLALVTHGLDRATVKPGEEEHDDDGAEHDHHAGELGAKHGRDGAQHGVVGGEVPHRGDVFGGLQRIGGLEVGGFEEEAAQVGGEEDDGAEDGEEDDHADDVLHRVIGMEGDAVEGDAVGVFLGLDLDAVRVVGTDLVQGDDVDEDQGREQEGQQEVEGKETVQGGVGDDIVAAHPDREVFTDARNGGEEVDDDLGTPVRHLPPGQQVAKEGGRHHGEVDHEADDPQQFARLAIRAPQQGAEHVEIDDDEEGRGAGGVHVTDQPAPVHVAHDVFDAGEGIGGGGLVIHGQPDTSQDLDDQGEERQGAEEGPGVEVFRGVILGEVFVPDLGEGETVVDPAEETPRGSSVVTHQATPPSSPILRMASVTYWCLGMTRLVGAGEPLKTRPARSKREPWQAQKKPPFHSAPRSSGAMSGR